jgi:hypothetical protein
MTDFFTVQRLAAQKGILSSCKQQIWHLLGPKSEMALLNSREANKIGDAEWMV